MKVYIVEHKGLTGAFQLSSEGYSSYEKAVAYIESRPDKPKQGYGWIWYSSRGAYRIKDIDIK